MGEARRAKKRCPKKAPRATPKAAAKITPHTISRRWGWGWGLTLVLGAWGAAVLGCDCDSFLEEPETSEQGQGDEEQPDERGEERESRKKPNLKTLSERGNQAVGSFDSAKDKVLEIYQDRRKTFYCGCDYEDKEVDLDSCGYEVRKSQSRAQRIEIEHVVPASAFGKKFSSWTEGHPDCQGKGRRCTGKVDEVYRYMEADLYNLRPAIGEVNADRSDKEMGEVAGEARDYGKCDFESNADIAEPRPEIRGDVARTYLYMDWAYPNFGLLHAGNRKLMEAWAKADPPDRWEKTWAKRVQEIQGNENPFID